MHKKTAFLLLAGSFAFSWTAHASFESELESLNRKQSSKVLEDFRKDIDTQLEELALTSRQIEESIRTESPAGTAGKKSPQDKGLTTVDSQQPVIPKDNLKELFGLQASAERTNVPLDLHPTIGMKTRAESNVFEKRIDAEPEIIYSYSPGIEATGRWNGWTYRSDYELTRLLHQNFDHNDRADHDWTQSLSRGGRIAWNFTGNFGMSAIRTELDTQKPSQYMTHSYSVESLFTVSDKMRLKASYGLSARSFLSDTKSNISSRAHDLDLNLAYDLSDRIEWVNGYTKRLSRPPEGVMVDVDFDNIYTGFNGKFTDKLLYRTRLIYQITEGDLDGTESRDAFLYAAALTYLYSAKTRFTLTSQSDYVPQVTQTATDPLNYTFGLSVDYQATRHISLRAGQSVRLIDYDADPVIFQDPDYPNSTVNVSRQDVRWDTNVSLVYAIDSTSSLQLNYMFLDVDTTIKTSDRTNQICEISYEKKF